MKDETIDALIERLFQATNAKNDSELSRLLGLSSAAVYKAKLAGSIPPAWIIKIAERFKVSADWLLFGYGSMRREEKAALIPAEEATASPEDLIMIPMVEAILSAGTGSLETSGQMAREYAFQRDFIQRKGNPANMVLMRVRGDSMQPEVMDNDVVLLDQSKTRLNPGPIYAVGIEDSIYLKRVDKLPGQVVLKSVNPAYEPIRIDMGEDTADQFRVIGQVLWVGREYK